MYTRVSFKYNGENIDCLFVVVYPTICSSPYYVVMGLSRESSLPTAIGQAGIFEDVSAALKRVDEIAEKYPRINYDTEFPEFYGI